uniref:Threonine--tRNA ligase n=1 Tax=candidate division WOR-3 bacterium TaxID=2052148 RepID=A0A7C3UP20_UNCW3
MKVKIFGKVLEVEPNLRFKDLILDENCLAVRWQGIYLDLSSPLREGEIEPVYFSSPEGKSIFWHSSAHLLAHAVKTLFPSTKLAVGPAIERGFYYDFDRKEPFSEDDLFLIEKKMAELRDKDLPIEKVYLKRDEAIAYFQEREEDYKLQIIEEIPDEEISCYRQGDFLDLCLGPHLPRTGMIKAFKLLSVAGAYWRGSEKNKMLSRIYGISFPSEEELASFLERLEEAKRRDHRKLGPELDLFSFHEEAGAGLVYWHPRGALIRRIIEEYWLSEHSKRGYKIVYTPHIAKSSIWKISGHYDYYKENMFLLPLEGEEYILKPMNCPGHILIYKSQVRSYRDLPLRFAELGTVYRNEKSGTLHGMLRVRGFTQDDAHIFCTPEMVEEEIREVLTFASEMLSAFGFKRFVIDLSVRDPKNKEKYMGSDAEWELAESALKKALSSLGLEYQSAEGEAVFYGPKIDIKLLDSLDNLWQATTIQFDFNLPRRFDVRYIGKDGLSHPAIIIHRTLLGSLERFIACLVEHYGGAFPVWLAPIQARVIPITDKERSYAENLFAVLVKEGIRGERDFRPEKINYKVAEAERLKIPYLLIVGKREEKEGKVSLRKRREGVIGSFSVEEVIRRIKEDVAQKR